MNLYQLYVRGAKAAVAQRLEACGTPEENRAEIERIVAEDVALDDPATACAVLACLPGIVFPALTQSARRTCRIVGNGYALAPLEAEIVHCAVLAIQQAVLCDLVGTGSMGYDTSWP